MAPEVALSSVLTERSKAASNKGVRNRSDRCENGGGLTSAETQSRFNADFGAAPMHASADDSAALVLNEQRKYCEPWGANPFRKAVEDHFIENVIQER